MSSLKIMTLADVLNHLTEDENEELAKLVDRWKLRCVRMNIRRIERDGPTAETTMVRHDIRFIKVNAKQLVYEFFKGTLYDNDLEIDFDKEVKFAMVPKCEDNHKYYKSINDMITNIESIYKPISFNELDVAEFDGKVYILAVHENWKKLALMNFYYFDY